MTNRSLDIEFELRPSVYDQRSSESPMDDQTPPKSRRDTPAGMSQPLTVDDLRRAADRWRDLRDPVLMAKAWDEPVTSDMQPATNSPRRFGQLRSLSVPETSMSQFLTRKSLHGKAIHLPKLRGGHPAQPWSLRHCDGSLRRARWRLYETATVLATAHQGGADAKTTLVQIQ